MIPSLRIQNMGKGQEIKGGEVNFSLTYQTALTKWKKCKKLDISKFTLLCLPKILYLLTSNILGCGIS